MLQVKDSTEIPLTISVNSYWVLWLLPKINFLKKEDFILSVKKLLWLTVFIRVLDLLADRNN
jgi:hypothetical protein